MAIKVLNEFLPEAEEVRLGGVKVGDTLSIDDGVLNTNSEEVAKNANRITAINGNVDVAVSGSTITLAAGSDAYIPDGFESDEETPKYKKIVTSHAFSYTETFVRNTMMIVNEQGGMKYFNIVDSYSGAIVPTLSSQWGCWYDTVNNIVKWTEDSGSTWSEGWSLPLYVVHFNGTNFNGLVTFDGFGYLAGEVFVLPSVHYIRPSGRDENGLPVMLSGSPNRVLRSTIPGPYQTFTLCFDENTLILTNSAIYRAPYNVNVDTNNALLPYLISNGEVLVDGSSKIVAFRPGYVAVNESAQFPYINTSETLRSTYWLNANKGRVFLNSRNQAGDFIGFDRYKSQNGVFTTAGYERQFMINYTSDATINANLNQVTHSLKLLDEDGNTAFPGSVAANGVIEATTAAALWADLAEKYVSDVKYPIGTLVAFGGEKEITIAKKNVNGVISEKPGFVLNKKGKGQPVALVGRVKVRVIGKVNKNDKLVLYKDGIARKKKWYDVFKTVIGITLESNNSNDEKLVMSIVRLAI